MAEPVSSILTIVTVSLALIKETVNYINKVQLVDRLVDRLLVNLKDLHRLIKVVESTYQRANSGENSEPSRFVFKNLEKCTKRLREVKSKVYELASRDANTFLQKAALKRRSDMAKKDIEVAIDDIHRYMDYIRTGMNCWSLDVASAHRRISEAMAAQALSIRTDQQATYQNTSPLSRTLSNAETVFEYDPIALLRRPSTETSHSRPSISSASSHALQTPSDDNESVVSNHDHASPKPNSDWMVFHFHTAKCDIQEIRRILQQHTEATTLVKSTDDSQRTPLHLAAQRGNVELGRILLDFGADINAKDSEPSTVLDLAVKYNHGKFVAFLLEQGVDEKAILDRNRMKFKEMKSVIEFSKTTTKSKPKKEGRKASWTGRRGLSI